MPIPQEQNPFYGKDFISVKQISDRPSVDFLFDRSKHMKELTQAHEVYNVLLGHTIPIIFYQPSTRTALSFMAAAKRLGADTITLQDMQSSSVVKGENLPDTIRAVENTTGASAIVLRHPDNNSSEIAAKYAHSPVINAGSGFNEHPTQALLDAFTIQSRLETIDNLKVALVGDLLYGRTVKSLVWLLAQVGQGNQMAFVSAPELALPDEYLKTLPYGTEYQQSDNIQDVLKWADVIYMTRTQREWFEQQGKHQEYENLKDKLMMTREMAEQMREDSIIMHPLPRQTELRYGVDENPRAAYFEQMAAGLFVRMALLESILTKKSDG